MTMFLVREWPLKGRYRIEEVERTTPGTFVLKGYGKVRKKNASVVATFHSEKVARHVIERASARNDADIERARKAVEEAKATLERLYAEKRAFIASMGAKE